MKISLWGLSVITMLLPASLNAADQPSVTHYDFRVQLYPDDQRIVSHARMSLSNRGRTPITELRILTYRLLHVDAVADADNRPLPYSQAVGSMEEEGAWQVNSARVTLPTPLAAGASTSISVSLSGYIFGYAEIMAYVHDRITPEYSLLRPDAFAYPILSPPSIAGMREAYENRYSYDVSVTVPRGLTVVCGGVPASVDSSRDSLRYSFHQPLSTWRIDIAVSAFVESTDPIAGLRVYSMKEDSARGPAILSAMKRSSDLFQRLFGPSRQTPGFTLIEIPDGWGSQGGDGYILQAAAAFKDSDLIAEVYHEIGHRWNVAAAPDIQRCRYFDEAFASFFQALGLRHLAGEQAWEADLVRARESFLRAGKGDQSVFDTPIAGYGAKEMGRYSYTKGAWSLYVLYSLVGEQTFCAIMRALLAEYGDRTADFAAFQEVCERTSGRDLKRYFQEWIYGSESSQLLRDRVPIARMALRYAR